jgi:glycine reductase
VGANRILPALGIPHPLGDPKLSAEEEKRLRRRLVEKAVSLLASVPPQNPQEEMEN